MVSLIDYIVYCLRQFVNNGLFLKFYIGPNLPVITLYGALIFCSIFAVIMLVLKKLYRW